MRNVIGRTSGGRAVRIICIATALVAACGQAIAQPAGSGSAAMTQPADQDRDLPLPLPIAQSPLGLPAAQVTVEAGRATGPLEMWRHTVGHGGINAVPLPDRVIRGAAVLRPRLIRIFIQEFFYIYPEAGRFDWSRLDPYMDALGRTGAKVVAAITIKPKPLYPKVDQRIWRPASVEEWQRVIAAMVKRYSVDKPLVTYWEIGNETDIGENGGCPYLITDVADYLAYYRMTTEPILATFPAAKVGGPAVANANGPLLAGFIDRCAAEKVRMDFISWHLYSDDPVGHAGLVNRYRKLLEEKFPGKRPEMLVTEWSKGFDPVSVEELAFEPRRAACTAAGILAMTDAAADWTFYYHLWDQVCHVETFRPFFGDVNIMYRHWNEVPHRFGLFGVDGEARPQYFVYWMLGRLGSQRLGATSSEADLRVLAGRDGGTVAALIANYGMPNSRDRTATVRFAGLKGGFRQLRTWRIDRSQSWSVRRLELIPRETRLTDVRETFSFQVLLPADSVCLVALEETSASAP